MQGKQNEPRSVAVGSFTGSGILILADPADLGDLQDEFSNGYMKTLLELALAGRNYVQLGQALAVKASGLQVSATQTIGNNLPNHEVPITANVWFGEQAQPGGRRTIGYVGVETGTIAITSLASLNRWEDDEFDPHQESAAPHPYSYNGAGHAGESYNTPGGGLLADESGLALHPGDDGDYPVIGLYQHGLLVGLKIDYRQGQF